MPKILKRIHIKLLEYEKKKLDTRYYEACQYEDDKVLLRDEEVKEKRKLL